MARTVRSKLPPFVSLLWKILNHKAYIKLSPMASKMLPYFLGKVRIPVTNPQHYATTFTFTYTEAKKQCGCSRSTFFDVIGKLIAHGFIDPVSKGGICGGAHVPSIFRLSRRWEDFGTAAFKPEKWGGFGQAQIQGQVQKLDSTVSKNGPVDRRKGSVPVQNCGPGETSQATGNIGI